MANQPNQYNPENKDRYNRGSSESDIDRQGKFSDTESTEEERMAEEGGLGGGPDVKGIE